MSEAFVPLVRPAKNNSLSCLFTSTVICGISLLPHSAKAKEEAVELPTVSVVESRENEQYNATESSYFKLNQPLVDTPRSVTTVTRQLMSDQGVTKVADALRNVPGISLAAGEGGNQGDNLMIRGFSARNDFFVDGMRDFGNYYRDPFNLESIEVIQGPSSILFGRGSSGGVIHQNSKQAFLGSKIDGTAMLGTNDLARSTVDVNEKIGKNSAFRVNAMAQTNKVAERDYARYRRNAIAPSLAFGVGTDSRLTLNYLHQNEDNMPDYGVPLYAGKPANVDRSNFYGFKSNDYLKTNTDIATAKFEHDFEKDLTFRTQTRYARYYRDVQVTEPQSNNATSVKRNMKMRSELDTYLGNQTDLSGKFSTFNVKHEAVIGFAMESESSAPTVLSNTSSVNVSMQNPIQTSFNNGATTFSNNSAAKVETAGIYALDTVKLSKAWELSLGMRFDNIRTNLSALAANNTRSSYSRTDNVLSYNAGVVYKPMHNGSIYLNQSTSFNPSAESLTLTTNSTTGGNNYNTNPEKNVSYELGTKWDLFKKKLSATFAVFQTTKDNARENNPDGGATNQPNSATQRVQGLLAQLSGKITDKWQIMTGYSYMDGKIIKSVTPSIENRPLPNVPKHTFSLFTTYKLDSKLELGGGANFVSQRFAGNATSGPTVDTVSGTFRRVPSYLIFNAMAKYPLNKKVDLQLNINNLTNEYYYDQLRGGNAVVPGEGRVILLSTYVKF